MSCSQNKKAETDSQNFFESGTVTITGQINNLRTDNSNTIFLKQNNLLSGKSEVTSFKIDTSGKFEKIISIYNSQDISLEYQDRAINLLVKQSDSLNLIIDAQNPDQDVIISGVGGKRNSLYNQYLKLTLNLKRDFNRKTSGQELDFILSCFDETEAKLDSIIKGIPDIKQDKLLASWIEADKKSLLNYNLIQYASNNESLPISFLANKGLITEKELNNNNFYCNRSYALDMLNNYVGGCIMKERRKFTADIITKLKNDDYDNAIKLLSDSIMTDFRNIGKDIVMYQLFEQMLLPSMTEMVGKELKIDLLKKYFLQNINSEFVKTSIINTSNEQSNAILEESLTGNLEEDVLGALMQESKNKVLYVDISATWCGPCIQEFPYSTTLHENLSDKEIVFVYLFAKSNLSDWKTLSAKYNLQGENILLSDEQYNFLLSKYAISSGFPQYLLIDKNGEVLKDAQRPSMKGTKEEILKLLN